MLSCFKKLQIKPREIGANIEKESQCHKIKVVGWSTFMLFVAGSYMSYFSGLTERANQMQNKALAGQLPWNEYDEPFTSDMLMIKKIQQDIIDSKDSKDLKYIEMGWMSQKVEDENNPFAGPQGNDPMKGWYTQTERVGDVSKTGYAQAVADKTLKVTDRVAWSQKQYDTWTTMHDASVSWFDTAGCNQPDALVEEHGYIGIVNQPFFIAASPWFPKTTSTPTGWWIGSEDFAEPINPATNQADWSTQVMNVPSSPQTGKITVSDDLEGYKSNLQNSIDMMDCDLDCQAKGSQLTVVAALNVASLALIVFNSLMGILGGWNQCGRITQTYCSFVACFLQLAVLISCGAMLFTPYSFTCYASMQPTFTKDSMWTMHDDYMTVILLWASQFIWMFIFFVIGMCGAVRVEK